MLEKSEKQAPLKRHTSACYSQVLFAAGNLFCIKLFDLCSLHQLKTHLMEIPTRHSGSFDTGLFFILDVSHLVFVAMSIFTTGLASTAVDHVVLLGAELVKRRDDEDASSSLSTIF